MKTIFFQGTFDILNAGHVRSIRQFDEPYWSGYRLVIGLNSDELVRSHKGRDPIIPFEQRKEILEGIKGVDLVIECDDPLALPYLKELNADAFASVLEWEDRQKDAIDWIRAKGGLYIRLTYYPDDGVILSSTKIRERVVEGAK